MKVVIDTNVLMSGIFFTGPPYDILNLWKKKNLVFVVSKEILDEYVRVGNELSNRLKSEEHEQIFTMLSMNSIMVKQKKLKDQICTDKDDDEFIACTLGGGIKVIISGDRHLLKVNGIFDIEVIEPRGFLEKYFS